MTLCNMAAELGGQTGMIAPDEVTREFLVKAGARNVDIDTWQPDPDAAYLKRLTFDASSLAPQVAASHSPANSAAVDLHRGTPVDQAYIGACTGAKLEDLHMAAAARITNQAAADGTLAALTEAGAILLSSGCGACAGYGAGVLAEGEVCISSTARNFKGRMGAGTSKVYLGSPYTVAAAAVAGRIADPREMLAETRR